MVQQDGVHLALKLLDRFQKVLIGAALYSF